MSVVPPEVVLVFWKVPLLVKVARVPPWLSAIVPSALAVNVPVFLSWAPPPVLMLSPVQLVVPARLSCAPPTIFFAPSPPMIELDVLEVLTVAAEISPPFQLSAPTVALPVPSTMPEESRRSPVETWDPLNFALPPVSESRALPVVLLKEVVAPLISMMPLPLRAPVNE